MTNEEAIQVIDDMKPKTDIPKSAVTQLKRNVALDMAIEALEKQIPKQVVYDGYGWYECSECHSKRPFWFLGKDAKWCPYCGHRVDWMEDENDNTWYISRCDYER